MDSVGEAFGGAKDDTLDEKKGMKANALYHGLNQLDQDGSERNR